MLHRRFPVLFWLSVIAVSGVGACGGSTSSITGPGGNDAGTTGGAGGSGAGTTGGSGGSGAGTTGGSGGSGAGTTGGSGGSATGGSGGNTGGTGGCIDPGTCGPDGSPCCSEGMGCASAGPGAGMSCVCHSGKWSCNSGTAGAGGTGGTGCGPNGTCGPGLTCCSGQCVNTANDINNCGTCGTVCGGAHPYCGYSSGGPTCSAPPCGVQKPPPKGSFCCGNSYCTDSQLCCMVQQAGPSSPYPSCITPSAGQTTCPIGCPACA